MSIMLKIYTKSSRIKEFFVFGTSRNKTSSIVPRKYTVEACTVYTHDAYLLIYKLLPTWHSLIQSWQIVTCQLRAFFCYLFVFISSDMVYTACTVYSVHTFVCTVALVFAELLLL